jgi:hypothetical protein
MKEVGQFGREEGILPFSCPERNMRKAMFLGSGRVTEVSTSWQIVRSGEGDRREFPWGEIRWLADEALGNSPEMTFGRVVIKAAERNPSHRHPNCSELLFLLRGRQGGASALSARPRPGRPWV